MKKLYVTFVCAMLVLSIVGCGKKSSLEGKIVDGKDQPMAKIKVVAKQVQPLKGYELFETTTGADGSFKFNKLYPESVYELIPSNSFAGNLSVQVESGPDGQTKILPAAILVRFHFLNDGLTVLDTKTGLMWSKNAYLAGKDMVYAEAVEWVKGLSISGHKDWRLPNLDEFTEFAERSSMEAFEGLGFNNVYASYWSNTTCEDKPDGLCKNANKADYAYTISLFNYPKVFIVPKKYPAMIWPVRSVK